MPLLLDTHLRRTRAQEVAGVVLMVDPRVGEDFFFFIITSFLPPVVESRVQTRGRGRTGGVAACPPETRALSLPLTLINVMTTIDQDSEDERMGDEGNE